MICCTVHPSQALLNWHKRGVCPMVRWIIWSTGNPVHFFRRRSYVLVLQLAATADRACRHGLPAVGDYPIRLAYAEQPDGTRACVGMLRATC